MWKYIPYQGRMLCSIKTRDKRHTRTLQRSISNRLGERQRQETYPTEVNIKPTRRKTEKQGAKMRDRKLPRDNV